MTDTKHELPQIDWSKPVEASFDGKTWFETLAVMRGNNVGQPFCDTQCNLWLIGENGTTTRVKQRNIRNKPEPLELWVNVYPDSRLEFAAHGTPEEAERCAGVDRIRCARMVEAPDQ